MVYAFRMNPLAEAIKQTNASFLGRACGKSYKTIQRWAEAGRLPKTDHLGITDFAERISRATGRKIRKRELLQWSLANWRKKKMTMHAAR